MASDQVISNQESILGNQEKILAAQVGFLVGPGGHGGPPHW
jgi:hypothetical protein